MPCHRLLALALLPSCLGLLGAQEPKPAAAPADVAKVGAAYAALVAGSAVFVSGRELDSVRAQELAPDTALNALIGPLVRFEVDRAGGTLTARLGQASATAVFVEGLGCVLQGQRSVAELRARAVVPADPGFDPAGVPWPDGERLPDLPWPAEVDRAALEQAVADAFVERAGGPVRTRAVVVLHRGRLICERYAEGFHAAMPLPGWSMTKSVVDALVGIRVAQDRLDPGAPLPVPEWSEPDDPRRALRLDDLLRMQSGLAWSEDYQDVQGLVARMLLQSDSAGAVAAARELAAPPGSRFQYSSGTTNLLCRVLRATFDHDADHHAFPSRALFTRIGMRSAVIATDPSGTFVGSSLGFATARDWARFGLLYLRGGSWNGVRILPDGWVARSWTPTPGAPRGGYGRHWWLNAGREGAPEDRPFPGLPRSLAWMSGFEGQYVAVLPEQDLVVVRLGCTQRGGFDLAGLLTRVLAACGG